MFTKPVHFFIFFIISLSLLFQNCTSKQENAAIPTEETSQNEDTTPYFEPENIPNQKVEIPAENTEEKLPPVYITEKIIISEPAHYPSVETEKISYDNYFYLTEEGEIVDIETPLREKPEIHHAVSPEEKIVSPAPTNTQDPDLFTDISNTEQEITSHVSVDTVQINNVLINTENNLRQSSYQAPEEPLHSEIVNKQPSIDIQNSTPDKNEKNKISLPEPEIIENPANIEPYPVSEEKTVKEKDTASLVVINGIPLDPSEGFKEIKLSDIESLTIVKENSSFNKENQKEQQTIVINTKNKAKVPSYKTTDHNKTIFVSNSALRKTSDNLPAKTTNQSDKHSKATSEIIHLYNSQKSVGDIETALSTIISFDEQKKPLYIIDGSHIKTSDLFSFILSNVDSSDIESISLIKGNSALSLYGNKATEGAVLVNTKTGNALLKVHKKIAEKKKKEQQPEITSPLVKI